MKLQFKMSGYVSAGVTREMVGPSCAFVQVSAEMELADSPGNDPL